MKYKLIIFDLDGTLLNTLDDLADSLNCALSHFGLPARSMEEVRHFLGNGMQKLVECGVPAETSAELTHQVFAFFTEYYRDHCSDHTKPYDGIEELLHTLKAAGIPTAVVSNKADLAVQILCEKYFPGSFDAISGAKDGIRKKPAPDTVNHVLSQLGISHRDAVYVGDSEVDLETSQNAHMDVISVDWGFRTRKELLASGAVRIVSSPAEILNQLSVSTDSIVLSNSDI